MPIRGTSLLLMIRAVRLIAACLVPMLVIGAATAQTTPRATSRSVPTAATAATPTPAAPGRASATRTRSTHAVATPSGVIAAIKVEGNARIEEGTIRSYLLVQPGDRFDADRLDRSLKTLYATGLFQDVRLERSGNDLIVHVVENPIVNRVAFENNHKLTDDQLLPQMRLRPRAVFTPALAESGSAAHPGSVRAQGLLRCDGRPENHPSAAEPR